MLAVIGDCFPLSNLNANKAHPYIRMIPTPTDGAIGATYIMVSTKICKLQQLPCNKTIVLPY